MEAETAVLQAQSRLRDTKTTMPTGLPKKTVGEAHIKKNNISLGQTQCSKKAEHCRSGPALLHFQAALETTQESGSNIHVIVEHSEGL